MFSPSTLLAAQTTTAALPPQSIETKGRERLLPSSEDHDNLLFALEKTATAKLFDETVKQGIFAEDFTFLKVMNKPLMPLPQNSALNFFREFKALGIFDLLLYIYTLEAIYPPTTKIFMKVVGSYPFHISGLEYAVSIFQELGIDLLALLSKEELNYAFKRPADIDIRIDLPGASPMQLKNIGIAIAAHMAFHHPKAKVIGVEEKGFENAFDCFRVITIEIDDKKFDLMLASKLQRQFLFGEDDYFFPLTPPLLQAYNSATGKKPIVIQPQGNLHQGWHAIPLRLTRTKWTDNVNKINIPGSLKFLISSVRGATCFYESFEKRLLQNLVVALNDSQGPERAIKLLHKLVDKHMPNHPGAFTAFCFNLQVLLELYAPPNAQQWRVLLLKELQKKNKEEEAIHKHEIAPVHELFKEQLLPFEVLSAFLLIHGHLLEQRKRWLHPAQPFNITLNAAFTGGRPISQLKYRSEPLTLSLEADPLKAIAILEKYFSDPSSPLEAKLLNTLDKLTLSFFPALDPSGGDLSPKEPLWTLKDQRVATELAPIAQKFLSSPPLKVIGFLLLCHSGEVAREAMYTEQLLIALAQLLTESYNPAERMTLTLSFLCYYRKNKPLDPLCQCIQQTNRFLMILSSSTSSKIEINKAFCKFFSLSSSEKIGSTVRTIWKKLERDLPLSLYISLGNELIGNLLHVAALQPAMTIFSDLLASKQTLYTELEPLFISLYEACKKQTQPLHALLRLSKPSLHLLDKWNAGHKQNFPFKSLIDDFLKNGLHTEALDLLKQMGTKANLSSEEMALIRFESAKSLFSGKQREAALSLLELSLRATSPAAFLPLLLSWRLELSKENRRKNALRKEILPFLFRACRDPLSSELLPQLIEALIEELSLESQEKALDPALFSNQIALNGQELLEALKIHCQKTDRNKETQYYFDEYAKLLAKPEFQSLSASYPEVLDYIASHFFWQLLLLLADRAEKRTSGQEEMVLLARKMLLEHSIGRQIAGFYLFCIYDAPSEDTNLFEQIERYLPDLIASSGEKRLQIFDHFCRAFHTHFVKWHPNPPYERVRQIFEDDTSTQETIAHAFCSFLKELDNPQTFKLGLAFWIRVANKSPVLGIELIEHYFFHEVACAVEVKRVMEESGTILPSSAEEPLHKLFQRAEQYKKEGKLSKEQLFALGDFTQFILDKTKNPTMSNLLSPIYWTIAHLLEIAPLKALGLLREAERKKKVTLPSAELFSLQLYICKQLYERDLRKRAFDMAKQLLSCSYAAGVIPLLIGWSCEDKSNELYELLIFSFTASGSGTLLVPLAESIVENSPHHHHRLFREESATLHHILKCIKGSSNLELINIFFEKIVDWHSSPLDLVEAYALAPSILQLLQKSTSSAATDQWLCKIAKKPQKIAKLPFSLETKNFYFHLADYFLKKDVQFCFFYLKLALSSNFSLALAEKEQWLSSECLTLLLKAKCFEEAFLLIKKITSHSPLPDAEKIINMCCEGPIEKEEKITLYADFIDCLLDNNDPLVITMATSKLFLFSSGEFFSPDKMGSLVNKAIAKFLKLKQGPECLMDSILRSIIIPYYNPFSHIFLHKIDPVMLLKFYATQTDHELLLNVLSCYIPSLLDNLREQLTATPSAIEVKRELITTVDSILDRLKGYSSCFLCENLLTHPKIRELFSAKELSKRWAMLILDDFRIFEINEEKWDLLLNGLGSCGSYLGHLTTMGPTEIACFDKTIDALIALLIVTNNTKIYKEILEDIFYQLSLALPSKMKSDWNAQIPDIVQNFELFSCDLNRKHPLCAITNTILLYLDQVTPYFTKKENKDASHLVVSESSLPFVTFIDRLIKKLVTYQTKNRDHYCFLEANTYFYLQQSHRLSLLSQDKIQEHLIAFGFRFIDFPYLNYYLFHLKARDHLVYTLLENQHEKLSPSSLFEIHLLINLELPGVRLLHLNEMKTILERTILSYCNHPNSGHTYRAMFTLFSCQTEILFNSPEVLKRCYHALFHSIRTNPFLEFNNTMILATGNASMPLLIFLNYVMFIGCKNKEIQQSYLKVQDLLGSKKMQATMASLFCDYFHLVIECQEMREKGYTYIFKGEELIEKKLPQCFIGAPSENNEVILELPKGKWIASKESRADLPSLSKQEIYSQLSDLISRISRFPFATKQYIHSLQKLIEPLGEGVAKREK